MGKYFIRFFVIICINLFAFLGLGYILGSVFGNRGLWLIIFLIVSILPLTIIMYFEVLKAYKDFYTLSPDKKDEHDNK